MLRPPNAEEIKAKQNVVTLMENDRQRLLMRQPFIGSVAMRMELIATCDFRISTAATNGEAVFADIRFYNKLNTDERLFVIAHEVWHCILLHFAREQTRDHHQFNYAADLEIHFLLQAEKMIEPFVLPHTPGWEGLSAEEIYEKLKRVKRNGMAPGNGRESNHIKSKKNGKAGFDDHIPKSGDGFGPAEAETAASNYGGDIVVDPDFNPVIHDGAVERIRAAVIQTAQQIERQRGTLPGHLAGVVERLQKPQLRWQELLAQFVTKCYGTRRQWLPPARRHVWKKLYLPGLYDRRLKAAVALDTSGSTINDLPQFFGELTALLNSFGNYELMVIQNDAEVQHVEKFDNFSPLPRNHQWELHGDGGTDFRPVFDHIAQQRDFQPSLLIFFTDGCGPAPERPPPYPVMWILTPDAMPPPWGIHVQFKPENQRDNHDPEHRSRNQSIPAGIQSRHRGLCL